MEVSHGLHINKNIYKHLSRLPEIYLSQYIPKKVPSYMPLRAGKNIRNLFQTGDKHVIFKRIANCF